MRPKKINFNNLEVEDIYSASMFILYKLNNIKEYSVISELPYILPRKDLLKFCSYFGGMTIKIPTVEELDDVFKLVLLYQYKIIEDRSEDTCRELLQLGMRDYSKLLDKVNKIEPLLSNYTKELNKNYE